MSLLLLFNHHWHKRRGVTAPTVPGWMPPAPYVPEKPKKKLIKKRRLIKITPKIKVPFEHFEVQEWYIILWFLQLRLAELEQKLALRRAELEAQLALAKEIEFRFRLEGIIAQLKLEHLLALEQLARVRNLMLVEEEEFMLFLMMQ